MKTSLKSALITIVGISWAAWAAEPAKLPKLVDLGADKCIPCKAMAPILKDLKAEYAGRMDVEFIDVWKNPDAGKTYKIKLIPTQIFFDASGTKASLARRTSWPSGRNSGWILRPKRPPESCGKLPSRRIRVRASRCVSCVMKT
jgi:thiol-disulfide isomerase/thioredoxin